MLFAVFISPVLISIIYNENVFLTSDSLFFSSFDILLKCQLSLLCRFAWILECHGYCLYNIVIAYEQSASEEMKFILKKA